LKILKRTATPNLKESGLGSIFGWLFWKCFFYRDVWFDGRSV